MRDLLTDDLTALTSVMKNLTEGRGFEAHPFKIGWYNESVGDRFALPYPDDTLAFVIISQPGMFEKSFLPFVANNLKKKVCVTLRSFQIYHDGSF